MKCFLSSSNADSVVMDSKCSMVETFLGSSVSAFVSFVGVSDHMSLRTMLPKIG